MDSFIQNLQDFPYERQFGVVFLQTPVRFLDTRTGQPANSACLMPNAQLVGGTDTLYTVRTKCTGISSDAKGIFGICYVLNHATSSYITFYPNTPLLRTDFSAQPYVKNRPYVSTTYYNASIAVVVDAFLSRIGGDGKFWVYTHATIDLVIDINGYFI